MNQLAGLWYTPDTVRAIGRDGTTEGFLADYERLYGRIDSPDMEAQRRRNEQASKLMKLRKEQQDAKP